MKKLPIIITAIIMAVLMASLMPMQVFAAGEENSGEYISEIKIGVGKKASEAEASLKGYTILKNGDKYADLNDNAGGGIGSKGDRVVYLGYKTTGKKSEAITDLAVMNMKGGYSVPGYEFLMDTHIKEEIIPFVNSFLAAIKEYRENNNSKVKANKQRAQYIHDALNKYTDDDTGKGLGDLFLNKTKFELGDAAYNKLSADEKKNHADIITIVAQSNGQATLMLENLITRAADTNRNTWLDRFETTTYRGLLDDLNMLPTDGKKKLAKLYDDDANKLLKLMDDFRNALKDYDEIAEYVEKYDSKKFENALKALNALTDDSTPEELKKANDDYAAAKSDMLKFVSGSELIAIHDKLEETEYNGATMLKFFSEKQKAADVYPLVASLSDGQRAGLDFVSLQELFVIAMTTQKGYKDAKLDDMEEVSIYSGVDRAIYKKNGVALTSDAIRTDAAAKANAVDEEETFRKLTVASMILSGASFIAFAGSGIAWATYASKLRTVNKDIATELNYLEMAYGKKIQNLGVADGYSLKDAFASNPELKTNFEYYTAKNALCKKLTIGLGVAMVVIVGITTWLAYEDLVNHYKVEFTPIPNYIVDEADITTYNANGEKTVIKNQAAYYKAVECNRTSADEMYKNLGTFADLNGDVGKQWLALYAEKNEAKAPILASSLLVQVNPKNVPANYETGIHMFGSDSAFNLNDPSCVWNSGADKIFVYFNVDENAANAAGSTFNGGYIALAGGVGLLAGALLTAVIMTVTRKKKEKA